jgi:hypothetical protein
MQKANTPPDFESIGEEERERAVGLQYFALFFFFLSSSLGQTIFFQNFK